MVAIKEDMEMYFIGVDVGTSSVRAALVTSDGKLANSATQAITIWEPETDFYEQSSDEIWQACCRVIKLVTEGIDVRQVKGLGFDATCSLVVVDDKHAPLPVSPSGDERCNIIMWMDHRAKLQTNFINSTQNSVLRFVGGSTSVEMQLPKLLWIKENLKETWMKAAHFFDLPDYLTFRATNNLTRSLCSLVCKWSYCADGSTSSWSADFMREIGFDDLVINGFNKIGNVVKAPGEPVGDGLSETAAKETGLLAHTPVSTSIIDAHAGGLGCLLCSPDTSEFGQLKAMSLAKRLVLICGTSTCHIKVSSDPVFVPGVWGPYFSVMVPGMWSSEGGQSSTGKLLEHVLINHPAYKWVEEDAERRQVHITTVLNEILEFIVRREGVDNVSVLTRDMHVYPDYHGNRSPLADPALTGMVCGLRLSTGAEDLAIQYLATVQALAYQTRQIISTMESAGSPTIELVIVCGGLAKNKLYVQSHADVIGRPVVVPDNDESVLLGSAMLAACASKHFTSIQDAMESMSGGGRVIQPNVQLARYHEKKYQVFVEMVKHQREYQQIMKSVDSSSASSL